METPSQHGTQVDPPSSHGDLDYCCSTQIPTTFPGLSLFNLDSTNISRPLPWDKHLRNMGPKSTHRRPMVTWIIAVQPRSRPHSPDYRCSIQIPSTSPGHCLGTNTFATWDPSRPTITPWQPKLLLFNPDSTHISRLNVSMLDFSIFNVSTFKVSVPNIDISLEVSILNVHVTSTAMKETPSGDHQPSIPATMPFGSVVRLPTNFHLQC